MRAGEFPDGAHVLRAKIDMASPNLNMRDPTLYRIRHASHHRTGDAWCIYPMYDYAHPLSDALEKITHSLCTLEFEDHRPLYDWLVEHLFERRSAAADRVRPAQPELHGDEQAQAAAARAAEARLRMGRSADADDRRSAAPRLHARVDPGLLLAHRRREEGERHRRRAARAQRARGSQPPRAARHDRAAAAEGRHHQLSRGQVEEVDVINNPEDPAAGTRKVPFSRVLYIEQDDFKEDPPKKFFRLCAGPRGPAALRLLHHLHRRGQGRRRRGRRAAVHLRSGHARRRCARRPQGEGDAALGLGRACRCRSRCGSTIGCSRSKIRKRAAEGKTFLDYLNPALARGAERLPGRAEPGGRAVSRAAFQFERLGYFCVDPDSRPGALVFNRTVSLRDTWARIEQRQ